jgi:hypothetical protein
MLSTRARALLPSQALFISHLSHGTQWIPWDKKIKDDVKIYANGMLIQAILFFFPFLKTLTRF